MPPISRRRLRLSVQGVAEAVIIRFSPHRQFRNDLCQLSMASKLPTLGRSREMADAGCTARYGVCRRCSGLPLAPSPIAVVG